jgi:uncharacterized protein YkuJ
MENLKNKFPEIKNELMKNQEIKNDEIKVNKWKKNWKNKINKDNKGKKDKWIILKNITIKNNELKLHYEFNKKIRERIIVNFYEIRPLSHLSKLMLSKITIKEFIEKEKFENYFHQENEGLIIYKDEKKIRIFISEDNYIEFIGLYDYDNMSKTLIVYKEEDNRKKIAIYKTNIHYGAQVLKYSKDLDINSLVDDKKLYKIKLIPCVYGYENQSVLFFIDNEIHIRKINSNISIGKNLILNDYFNYNNFDEFQFIVYLDFLLILKFNEEKNQWEIKVISLYIEDNSIFKEIETTSKTLKNINKDAKFSFAEIKEKKYLFAIYKSYNKYTIKYWEIYSKISGISINPKVLNINENETKNNFELANCIINYFYHCFEKFPLLGALQFNFNKYENKKKINLSFYLDGYETNNFSEFKTYINALKKISEKKKKISFDDIDFNVIDEYNKNYIIKNSSLGRMFINFLEIIPIQIAKIIGREFKVMSNGENIDKIIIKETQRRKNMKKDTKINISEYSNMINFSMKESIFEFFELPVIVICCFGTQSIGKSTFLNELTGSLFDVSGMRCTEGIWMSIKLFIHSMKSDSNKCNKKCHYCKQNDCYLLRHDIKEGKKCICENCACGKECVLNGKDANNKNLINCNLKCCLEKEHENLLNCVGRRCNCKCICECKCEKNHKHLCKKCKNENKKECECECNCKHLCKYPILLHNFICVCLDFEGLGTFERTSEQDIKMALIGSAMGNSIIFRTHNSFDRFTEETLEKLSLGSRKLKEIEIQEFFGGFLFFCPRDVISTNQDQLKKEFSEKIINSVKKWNNEIKKNEINNKYDIFGLFNYYVFAPTPPYNDDSFYKTLQQSTIKDVVGDVLKYQRSPIYKTGKEFYKNLKSILSAIYMNDYEFLSKSREDEIKNYIDENKEKAYEVCGEYEDDEQEFNDINYIHEINQLKFYFNNNYLRNLEINFLYNKKFENNDDLTINNIPCQHDIEENNIKIEEYGIILNIEKKKKNNISINIKNFKDFGLILMIPKKIKKIKIKNNDLCLEFFKFWNNICKKLNFKEKEIIDNFNEFISSLIKRRNDNVIKWLKEITKDYKNQNYLQNLYSPLDNIWKLCNLCCKYCFLKCYKLQGHENIHECPFDHNCKEKCSICEKCKCIDENCETKCNCKLGHNDQHICAHLHQCNEKCAYNLDTENCKGRCILEFGHKEKHNCGVDIHECKNICYLAGKSKNCGEKCIYPYPHKGKHSCGNTHYCKEKCKYFKKSEGCKEICNLEYGHNELHTCKEKHYCKENCYLKDKAKNCGEKCKLEYPHEGKHSCGNTHYCKEKCKYFKKSEGCKEICNLEYGHNELHTCKEKHYCKENCYLKDKAKNCGEKCKLEYPHDGNHICNNSHKCKKECSLKDKSIKCNKDCCLEYGHNNECKCDLKEHICNQKCKINKNCKNECSLIAGHEGNHLCGKCTCSYDCQYYNCSLNCNKKCYLKGGHKEEHICEIKGHKCKHPCCYKNNSKNCNKLCKFILENETNHNSESEHFCEISKEEHGCSGFCHLKEYRNCKNYCIFEVNHQGEHLCSFEKHLCKEKCYLKRKSIECKEDCCKEAKHEGRHICSLKYEEHICNKKCNYYIKPGKKCEKNCSQQADHEGNCICEKSKNQHICNEDCEYNKEAKGCDKYCKLFYGHEGEHNCGKKYHLCKKECSLYRKTRTKNRCLRYCNLLYKHKGICKCSEDRHLCDQECKLNEARNCKTQCSELFGHDGEHLCDTSEKDHLCQKNCYYYDKFIQNRNEKAKCNKLCEFSFGHNGKCICKEPYNHPCEEKCSLYGKSNGCNEDCSLEYEHEGEHICTVKKNFHTCKEKCELCKVECGHAYAHENIELICNKCTNKKNKDKRNEKKKCELSLKGHLCGGQHKDNKDCEIMGTCIIESGAKEERFYTSKSGEKIPYIIILQEIKKLKCSIDIGKNKFSHNGKHECENKDNPHKCGFKCIQCGYYCSEKYGHSGLHFCNHGSILNSCISISDSKVALVKKNENYYKFIHEETARAFNCEEYCRTQGQGHTHLIKSENEINNENIKFIRQESNYYLYECKCNYFWENILKFTNTFLSKELKEFGLCNWYCDNKQHEIIKKFCQLPLWHEYFKGKKIPKNVPGIWISKGHILDCNHPGSVNTIFLVDQSGSMSNKNTQPTEAEYRNKEKMNNMLGAAIEALINYCKKRENLNPKDICSLIGYNEEAKKIFQDIPVSETETIKNYCFDNLDADGCTHFKKAFIEAKKIIDVIDRLEYIPVIILLTDGMAHDSEDVMNYLENEVRL